MIRDPSDGSVKPPPPKRLPYDSGLSGPENETEWDRTKREQDQEWLKNWKERNGR